MKLQAASSPSAGTSGGLSFSFFPPLSLPAWLLMLEKLGKHWNLGESLQMCPLEELQGLCDLVRASGYLAEMLWPVALLPLIAGLEQLICIK